MGEKDHDIRRVGGRKGLSALEGEIKYDLKISHEKVKI